jgi:Ca-activated chloride channel family protein
MYSCLSQAAQALSADTDPNRKRLVILMTDGKSDTNGSKKAVDSVRALGVPVIAIAFGKDADPDQLKEVANGTGGTFVQQNDLVAALRQAAGYK